MSQAKSLCTRWGMWSYRLKLNKPLSVLGENSSFRTGWIVGRINTTTHQWQFGEIAPIPSFHNININDVQEDIRLVLAENQSAKTALVQNVLDIWNSNAISGVINSNALLGSSLDQPSESTVIKIKLGRRSIDEEISWFKNLQVQNPHTTWRLDCNKQWSLSELKSFWSICNPSTIDYIEDPLLDATMMADCPEIPFALDESLSDLPDLLHLPNVIAMVIKPTLHKNWRRIFSDHPSKRIVFSSTFEGSLGIWGLSQLALLHAPEETHGLGTLSWFKEECVIDKLNGSPLQISQTPPTPRWDRLKLENGE